MRITEVNKYKITGLVLSQILIVSCNTTKVGGSDREVKAYLALSANVIMESIDRHELDEIPPRDGAWVDLVDKLITHDPHLIEDNLPRTLGELKDAPEKSEFQFSFPSTFISKKPLVKSGFLKTDTRRYGFVFVALRRNSENEQWKKSSIILTRDRDIIYQEDSYVDDNWISENLEEFPRSGSRTFLLIEEFNRNMHVSLSQGDEP